jgi:undecaprenyl-diphosphatase
MLVGEMGGAGKSYLMKLGAAFVLTGLLGLVAMGMGLKLPEDPRVIAWTLMVGGVLILVAEAWLKRHAGQENPGWGAALVIGASQMLAAVFPGTSRSGASILAGMFAGLSRSAATDFSFLLGIPTLFAACGLSFYRQLKSAGVPGQEEWLHLGLGFAVSGVTAYLVVRWLLGYVRSRTFSPFGWYRIGLGLVWLVLA